MAQSIAAPIPSQHKLRAELEAMVLGDLLGPAGVEGEDLTECPMRDRYLAGSIVPARNFQNHSVQSTKLISVKTEADKLPQTPHSFFTPNVSATNQDGASEVVA
jgi:hypothetical protein